MNANAPTVAVIGSARLAKLLAEAGFRVLTDPDFRKCATLINTEIQRSPGTIPIVADQSHAGQPGFAAYLSSLAPDNKVIVLATRPDMPLMIPKSITPDLPTSIGDVMLLCGYGATSDPVGQQLIEPEPGSYALPPAQHVPVPLPLPVAAPAQPEPVQATAEASTEDAALAAEVARRNQQAADFLAGDTPVQPAAPEPVVAAPAAATPEVPAVSQDNDHLPDFLRQLTAAPAPAPIPIPVQPAAPTPTPTPAPAPAAELPWMQQQPAHTPTPLPAPTPVPVALPWAPEPLAPAPTPAPQSAPWPTQQPQPITPAVAARPVSVVHRLAPVLFVGSGSGGVGKTSTTLSLGKEAARFPDFGVVVIDGNAGQSDAHKRMQVPDLTLNTIYDTEITGTPEASFITPNQYGPYRAQVVPDDPLGFAVVFGPPKERADLVSATAYAQAIDYARSQPRTKLVIVDTQIAEAIRSPIFDEVIIPRLRGTGAYFLGVYSYTKTSADNLNDRIREMVDVDGVSPGNILVVASMLPPFSESDTEAAQRSINGYGVFAGVLEANETYRQQMNVGRFRTDLPAVNGTLNRILHTVTGDARFVPAAPKKRTFWLLDRFKR